MTRWMLFIAGLVTLVVASDAEACGRCGLFGRRCKYSSSYYATKYVAPAAYVPPANKQTFIFNNAFASQPLAGHGASVLGYSHSAQAEAPSRGLLLSQSARLTENAQTLAGAGLNGFTALAQIELDGQNEVAKTLAQGQAATAALLAAR